MSVSKRLLLLLLLLLLLKRRRWLLFERVDADLLHHFPRQPVHLLGPSLLGLSFLGRWSCCWRWRRRRRRRRRRRFRCYSRRLAPLGAPRAAAQPAELSLDGGPVVLDGVQAPPGEELGDLRPLVGFDGWTR